MAEPETSPGFRAAGQAARESYGKLLALLSRDSRDIAAAEDALSFAFAKALETWPDRGVPQSPEAWILATARRNLIDASRHRQVQMKSQATLELITPNMVDQAGQLPDERLKLMFACAHPAIDEAIRAPLMLQTLLGLEAAEIAPAFLASPGAMAQRLVRAKAKIKTAGIRFEVPGLDELPSRLGCMLSAIYAAYGHGWGSVDGAGTERRELAAEAIYLARLLCVLLPDAAEAHGLLALMLYCEARHPARRDKAGGHIPLASQDTGMWRHEMIAEAERALATAARLSAPGRYQTEAAIQSLHCQAVISGKSQKQMLALLYDVLAGQAPVAGVLVSRAIAHADLHGPGTGLELLDAADGDNMRNYQPWWAARADLLRRAGRIQDACEAYDMAIGLSEDPAVGDWLAGQKKSMDT